MSEKVNRRVMSPAGAISGSNITVEWTLPKFLSQLARVTGVTSLNPVDHLIFVRVLMANILVYEDALRGIDPRHPLLPHVLDPVEPTSPTATAAVLHGEGR